MFPGNFTMECGGLPPPLKLGLMQFTANKWAIHKGASKLAHSKGFAFDKKYAA
jgi:hypothetical protein